MTLAKEFGLSLDTLLGQTPYDLALWNATAQEYASIEAQRNRHARS